MRRAEFAANLLIGLHHRYNHNIVENMNHSHNSLVVADIYPSITRKQSKALARLGVAGHLSTILR